ncbi:MAG: GNAT family N-acetyltransferase [Parcubacteria group bacterium]|jgi:N-acetylglutamate synthase-like GNAT family acetyltransferase
MKKDNGTKFYLLRDAKKLDGRVLKSINDLLGFLSPNNYSVDRKRVRELLNNDLLEIYLLEADGEVIGMGSLHYVETLVKKAAWIEDIVVHPEHRSKGLGKKIIKHIISQAKKRGARHVDLTSRNNRKKAHQFYQNLNFEKRDTSVYRMKTKK